MDGITGAAAEVETRGRGRPRERRFDEAQLSSGDVYEVNVTTHSGDVYTLKYWGGGCGVGADGAVE